MHYAENNHPGEEQAKKYLLPYGKELEAFEEILYTHEAIFQVINNSELEETVKNTLYRLEKHLEYHVWLLKGRIHLI